VGERTPTFWGEKCVKSDPGILKLMGAGSATTPEMQTLFHEFLTCYLHCF